MRGYDCISRRGGPWTKRFRYCFLDIGEVTFGKIFCDLSLATRLALVQVSVINDLKRTKNLRTKENNQETIVPPHGIYIII